MDMLTDVVTFYNVHQNITLHALDRYNFCQLYLGKAGKNCQKKKEIVSQLLIYFLRVHSG